jgi:hypothetical protein
MVQFGTHDIDIIYRNQISTHSETYSKIALGMVCFCVHNIIDLDILMVEIVSGLLVPCTNSLPWHEFVPYLEKEGGMYDYWWHEKMHSKAEME